VTPEHADRVPGELGRAPTTGITRAELAILMLDVVDDVVSQALDELVRSGQVSTSRPDGPSGSLVRYHLGTLVDRRGGSPAGCS
jgi:hypothetical protein